MLNYFFAWSVQFLGVALILMIGAVPAALSVFLIARNQRNNKTDATYRQLMAATASIIVALAGFGLAFYETKSFSSQSLGNIMYFFAVQVTLVAWVVGYLLGLIIDKSIGKTKPVAKWVQYSLRALIVVFAFEVVRHVAPSVDVELVRSSENTTTLTYLALRASSDETRNGEITWRIASHQLATSSALSYLSKHHNNSIRLQVAKNQNTSVETLLALSADCNEAVRLEVVKRIPSATVTTPAINCPDDRPTFTYTPYL